MIGRNDLPHIFQMSRSLKAATHVGRMVARYARDRLTHQRGTRLVNGNALIARMAVAAFARGIPLWLSAPIVELRREGARIIGAMVDKEGRRLTVTTRLGVVLACGGFPGNDALTRRLYAHRCAGKNHATLPPPGNAGDGLRLAQSAGGRLHDAGTSLRPGRPCRCCRSPDGSLVPFPHFYERGKPGYISVDRRGRRFVNESKSYHVYVPELIEACRADPVIEAWIVCDHAAIRRFGLGALGPAPMPMTAFLTSGYIKRADSPRDPRARLRHRRGGAPTHARRL